MRRSTVASSAAKHCSSLCSQSEGDVDYSELRRKGAGVFIANLLRTLAFSRRERGPHFASKVSYSASPQSEGDEDYSRLMANLLRTLAFSRRERGPHFASKVSYSASPQSARDDFYSEHAAKERAYSGLKHFRDVFVALTAAKHCSSLCSQSEGDEGYNEHATKEGTYSEPIADFSILATYSWPSLCEQSELQCWRPIHRPRNSLIRAIFKHLPRLH